MMTRRVVVIPGPAWRPPAYRPPPPELGKKQIGQTEVKLNWGNLGQTILFGTLGAGALYGSGLLPDPVKTIATVGGVGLIGYAAYSFIGSAPKVENEVPSGTGSRIPTAAEFAAVTGHFLQPKSGSSQGFNWFSDTYPVKVLVSNPSKEPVTITLELAAREAPKMFWLIPFGTSDEYVAETKTVVLPANGNISVDFSPSVKTTRWLSGKINLDLVLRKVRMGGEIAELDHVSVSLV